MSFLTRRWSVAHQSRDGFGCWECRGLCRRATVLQAGTRPLSPNSPSLSCDGTAAWRHGFLTVNRAFYVSKWVHVTCFPVTALTLLKGQLRKCTLIRAPWTEMLRLGARTPQAGVRRLTAPVLFCVELCPLFSLSVNEPTTAV